MAHPMKALAHCLKAMPSSPILTEAGRELYDRAAQILADGEAVENEAIAHSAAPRGNVRLAAPISFGVLRIAPILPEFLTLYPDVTMYWQPVTVASSDSFRRQSPERTGLQA